jgi:hypothetical protein
LVHFGERYYSLMRYPNGRHFFGCQHARRFESRIGFVMQKMGEQSK